jgi:hypothetical protein
MMDNDIRFAPKGIIETLSDRIAELEELEAIGAATPDTCEELADLHEFLDNLHAISLEHARKGAALKRPAQRPGFGTGIPGETL